MHPGVVLQPRGIGRSPTLAGQRRANVFAQRQQHLDFSVRISQLKHLCCAFGHPFPNALILAGSFLPLRTLALGVLVVSCSQPSSQLDKFSLLHAAPHPLTRMPLKKYHIHLRNQRPEYDQPPFVYMQRAISKQDRRYARSSERRALTKCSIASKSKCLFAAPFKDRRSTGLSAVIKVF